jgi:hypothetical protein
MEEIELLPFGFADAAAAGFNSTCTAPSGGSEGELRIGGMD